MAAWNRHFLVAQTYQVIAHIIERRGRKRGTSLQLWHEGDLFSP